MKEIQDEEVEALTSSGLTVLQAKVYMALVKSGNATVKEISKTAGVARQDLYRITSELQKLGLVEKVIVVPTEFKAIELTDAVSILFQRTHEEEIESHKKLLKLMQRYKNKNVKATLQEEEPQFILVSEREVVLRIRRIIENAQTSLDVITTLDRFRSGMIDFDEAGKKAVERGVKFRLITSKPESKNSLTEMVKAVTKNPFFEIRHINTSPLAVIGICDKKEVIIAISATAHIDEVPILMSNNPSLVAIAQSYFETMWSIALEFKPEQP